MEKKPRLDTDYTPNLVRSVRDVPPAHYVLRIESFSLLSKLLQKSGDDKYESNEFEAGGYKWKLRMDPNGTSKEEEKYLSLYLTIHDNSILRTGWKVYAEYKLIVKDQVHDKDRKLTGKNWFSSSTFKAWGFSNFMSHRDLKDERKGFLVNDSLVVEGEITLLSVVNRFA